MGGLPFYTAKETGAVFIPLPVAMWRLLPGWGTCHCGHCDGSAAADTLVIPGRNDRQPRTFTVHMPELRGETPTVPAWLVRGRLDYFQP